MPEFDPASLGLGAVVVAICGVVGSFVKRSTAIQTRNIDDRTQQNRDLMFQVDFLWRKNDRQSRIITQLRERDRAYYGILNYALGEVRLLLGSIRNMLLDCKSASSTKEELEDQAQNLKEIALGMQTSMNKAIDTIPKIIIEQENDTTSKKDIMNLKEDRGEEDEY